jgi:hypothetical protein
VFNLFQAQSEKDPSKRAVVLRASASIGVKDLASKPIAF